MKQFWKILFHVVIIATSVLFYRGVKESFDLTKATILWVIGVPLAIVLIGDAVTEQGRKIARRNWHWLSLIAAFAISAVSADQKSYALFGQTFRFTGLLTIFSAMAVGYLIVRGLVKNPLSSVAAALSVSSIVCCVYVWLQASGNDPFSWGTASFGTQVFGTVGNPNTASGFISVSMPIFVAAIVNRETPRTVWLCSSIAFGLAAGSIPSLVSFQGQVVSMVTAVAIFAYALLVKNLPSRVQMGLLGLATIALFGGAVGLPPAMIPIFGALSGFVTSLLIRGRLPIEPVEFRAVRWKVVGPVLLILLGGLSFIPSTQRWFRASIADGFIERGDFYRAALSVFRSHPILGGGLEQFGFQFPSTRPEGHAVLLEASRTTSVHSVPLALLSAGGILLAAVFAVFVFQCFRRLWKSRESSSLENQYWLTSAFLILLLQISVGVEHVSMYLQLFVIAGLMSFASTASGDATSKKSKLRENPKLVGAFVILFLLLIAPLSRTFRAGYLSLRATRDFNSSGDVVTAIRDFERVVELSPWEFGHRSDLGTLYQRAGRYSDSASQLIKAAEITSYLGPVSLPTVEILAADGRLPEAIELIVKIQANDRYAPALKAQCLSFLDQIADAYLENNQPVEAGEVSAIAQRMRDS